MRPLEIHLDNCNELISDERRRVLSGEARKWANAGMPPRSRWPMPTDYFLGIRKLHERLLWLDVYRRRRARISRMAQAKGAA